MTADSGDAHGASTPDAPESTARIPLGVRFRRALRLRCPRCGDGRLFRGYFAMHKQCDNCQLTYERAPGYFLGSTYINYGLTTVLMTISFVVLNFGMGIEKHNLIAPLLTFVIVFPTLFFRLSRSFWIGFDCFIDRTDFREPESPLEEKR